MYDYVTRQEDGTMTGKVMRKRVLCHMRAPKAQISLLKPAA